MIQRVWYVEDDVWSDPLETTIKVNQPFFAYQSNGRQTRINLHKVSEQMR